MVERFSRVGQASNESGAPERASDQVFYGADDGIRTRDPNLGNEMGVVFTVRLRPLNRCDASTTSTPCVASTLICSSPSNAFNGCETSSRRRRWAPPCGPRAIAPTVTGSCAPAPRLTLLSAPSSVPSGRVGLPGPGGGPVEERIEERAGDGEGSVERGGQGNHRPSRLAGVSRSPHGPVGHVEADRKRHAPARGFRDQGGALAVGGHGCAAGDGHHVHEVLEARRRQALFAVSLEGGDDLVGHVVDERVDAVAVLFNVGHEDPGERWDRLRVPGHVQVGADEINAELGPDCRADERRDGEADAPVSTGFRAPISNRNQSPMSCAAAARRSASAVTRASARYRSMSTVARAPRSPRQQRGGTFHDPAVVDQVQPLEQPVVRELPLELPRRSTRSAWRGS